MFLILLHDQKKSSETFEFCINFLRAEIFHSLWGIFAELLVKKIGRVRSGHEVMTS